jgi:hypothetical protein
MSRKTTAPAIWVVRRGNGYIVRVERRRIRLRIGATQRAAMAYARSLARSYGSELVVQGRNGRIRVKDSHGHDPMRTPG